MSKDPCLVRSSEPGFEVPIRVGHPVLDGYLAGTLAATAKQGSESEEEDESTEIRREEAALIRLLRQRLAEAA